MYCINCGKKLEAGQQFCMNCGKKIEPWLQNRSPAPGYTMENRASVTPVRHTHTRNNKVIAVVGAAVVILVVAVVLTQGSPRQQNIVPYNYNPYNNSQSIILPPADFSSGFDDSNDSYSYGNSAQTCRSCYGSGSCDTCNGTGQFSMYGNPLDTCPSCDGSRDCSICGGDGVY